MKIAELLAAAAAAVVMSGCAAPGKTVVQTVTIDKPVAVPCDPPAIERPTFALGRVSEADDELRINRAMRAELEQRQAYEKRLEAAVAACRASVGQ